MFRDILIKSLPLVCIIWFFLFIYVIFKWNSDKSKKVKPVKGLSSMERFGLVLLFSPLILLFVMIAGTSLGSQWWSGLAAFVIGVIIVTLIIQGIDRLSQKNLKINP